MCYNPHLILTRFNGFSMGSFKKALAKFERSDRFQQGKNSPNQLNMLAIQRAIAKYRSIYTQKVVAFQTQDHFLTHPVPAKFYPDSNL